MPKKEIFSKQMARKLKPSELAQVGGGYILAHTMRPGSCSGGGGNDWVDTGMDVEF